MKDIFLSPHFTLAELTHTIHTDIDNAPSPQDIQRLQYLAVTLLEPLRAKFGPLEISSGFRTKPLNERLKGQPDSAHLYGCAADFVPRNAGVAEVVVWVMRDSGLPYDQVIDENKADRRWCHIGIAKPGRAAPRREGWAFANGAYRRL